MKKLSIIVVVLAFVIAIATGCSHNVVTYSDGVGFETTMRPDTGNFGITFRYGKILSVTARENTEVEMTGAGDAGSGVDKSSATASASGNVKVKIGRQLTGYYVDAIKAGVTPEQLERYTADASAPAAQNNAKSPGAIKDTGGAETPPKTPENAK